MTHQPLMQQDEARTHLLAHLSNKDQQHRLSLFVDWLQVTGRRWDAPDLRAYRDHLLHVYTGRDGRPLSASSAKAHLSTIRGQYRRLLKDNAVRDRLYKRTPSDASPADRKAYVDEALSRLKNAVDPDLAPVTVVAKQDTADAEHLRLTSEQARSLLQGPGIDTLPGLRDTALFALMLSTGIREAELIALDVADLRQSWGEKPALLVREGKGAKQRLVPYGTMVWCLVYVDRWLSAAGIASGAVFRGIYKGGKRVRETRLNGRSVNKIFDRYRVMVDRRLISVQPHTTRRTYARLAYDAGQDILAIRDNLGHADHVTTEKYIGRIDSQRRQTPLLIRPPHNLKQVEGGWVL